MRHALSETNKQSTEDLDTILKERFARIAKQIPTTNWRPLPSPVYSRKPSQKRARTPRKNSLLRNEFKPEDACGPEAWEDSVVLPVYEAVDNGWDFPWTAETKSLAEELAEDDERKKQDMKDRGESLDGEGDGDGEAEGNAEDDEEDFGGEDDCEDEAAVEESAFTSSGELPEPIEAEVNESSVKVRYRFRKTTRGCKAQVRRWELVEVWA